MRRAAASLAVAGFTLCAAIVDAAADDRSVCGSAPPKPGAIAACNRVIAAPSTSAHDRALALMLRADLLRAQGDIAGAIADDTQAVTLLPALAVAWRARGLAYLASGDNAKALADFDKALSLDAQDAKALYGRGLAKQRSGDPAGGDADIAAAKKLNPSIAEPL